RQRHCQTPTGGHHDPAGVLSLGFVEEDVRHHAIAHENEQCCADEFCGEGCHVLGKIKFKKKIMIKAKASEAASGFLLVIVIILLIPSSFVLQQSLRRSSLRRPAAVD